ncbi:MAG: hypothetical protein EBT08_02275, partial [Betaproteobacteria bacterium]|nr:hypothetical protein [Betaproteobacteria bacterium]
MPTCYDRIAKEIDHAGGWLRFDQYMALALYAPEVGYYERPHSLHPPNRTHPTNRPELAPANPLTPPTPPSGGPIGSPTRGGDFVTAPELSPLFASALSAQLCEWFESVPARVLEFGAGTGQLAADLLQACAHAGRIPEEYAIVEISASMRERQRATIAQLAPDLAARVRWLDQLPAQIEGVVLANELLDALPVRLFVADAGQVLERGVVRLDPAGFAWSDRPAEPAFALAVARAIDEAGWSIESAQGYLSE